MTPESRQQRTVDRIITAALAPPNGPGDVPQCDAAEFLAAFGGTITLSPGVRDLGEFEVAGLQPGDAIVARRLEVDGRVVRCLVWLEPEER